MRRLAMVGLLLLAAVALAPACGGAGGGPKIAFTSLRDGNGEIYVMKADGSGLTNLTNNPADDSGWRFGSRAEERVFCFPNPWSPDGGRMVFLSNRDGNSEVNVMNADGSGQTNLTNNPADDHFGLAWPANPWSPDGRRIVFLSERDGNPEVYVINADGSGQTNLTNNPAHDDNPAWSPDSSKIAFASNREAALRVYVMNADGSGQTQLSHITHGPGRQQMSNLGWSPNGTRIAFAASGGDIASGAGLLGNVDVLVMNADGSGLSNVTWDPAGGFADDGLWGLDWSPDSSKIAFVSDRDGSNDIYVMNADGSGLTRLTSDPAQDGFPAWSPAR